jgi:hypothetical protein
MTGRGYLHEAVFAQHQVVGFAVPVHDPRRTRRRQGRRGLRGDVQQFRQLQGVTALGALPERDAFDVLGGDEVHGVALADFVDGKDVRMVECHPIRPELLWPLYPVRRGMGSQALCE